MGSKLKIQVYMPLLFFIYLVITTVARIFGFSLIGTFPQSFFYGCLFLIAIITAVSFRRYYPNLFGHRYMNFFLPITPIIVYYDSLFVMAIIAILIVSGFVIFKHSSGIKRALSVVGYSISVILCCLFLFMNYLFGDFGVTKIAKEVNSPNGQLKLLVLDVDQGALGGETIVKVRKVFWGFIQWEASIYLTGLEERPSIQWVNDKTVLIDHKPIKVNIWPGINPLSSLITSYNKTIRGSGSASDLTF